MNVFAPNTHIQSVGIVGCGGTGAQVARIVARLLVSQFPSFHLLPPT